MIDGLDRHAVAGSRPAPSPLQRVSALRARLVGETQQFLDDQLALFLRKRGTLRQQRPGLAADRAAQKHLLQRYLVLCDDLQAADSGCDSYLAVLTAGA
jgi:hypothetical protein